ncbi:MAG: hypothetical protein HOE90_22415 [Bacteriovoracaceae bacterium]|nr:hypothetical protein [Bacteriovoracaceae bacterium]
MYKTIFLFLFACSAFAADAPPTQEQVTKLLSSNANAFLKEHVLDFTSGKKVVYRAELRFKYEDQKVGENLYEKSMYLTGTVFEERGVKVFRFTNELGRGLSFYKISHKDQIIVNLNSVVPGPLGKLSPYGAFIETSDIEIKRQSDEDSFDEDISQLSFKDIPFQLLVGDINHPDLGRDKGLVSLSIFRIAPDELNYESIRAVNSHLVSMHLKKRTHLSKGKKTIGCRGYLICTTL